jgi:glucosamine-6-phosphate deaminase
MRIIRVEDYQAMSRLAARHVCDRVSSKPNMVLGLLTGGTVEGMYDELVSLASAGEVDFSSVTTVNTDEYFRIGRDNDQSYYYFMQHRFFSQVNIRPDQINFLNGEAQDPVREGARYDAVIEKLGGVDLQVLGIGRNGHIAFIEPDDSGFMVGAGLVNLTEQTLADNARFFPDSTAMPRQAITVGAKAVMGAKEIMLLVSGKSKSEALAEAFTGRVTPRLPASLLQLHPNITVVADEDAVTPLLERLH